MSNWKQLLGAAAFAVPITVTFLDVFGYVAKVEGSSMQPCLNPAGNKPTTDYVLLNRWSIRSYHINQGEVVSLMSPSNSDQKIIKRVVALEGDVVRTLNYKRRYVRVPDGHCWVEGDHHGHSMDSNIFGPVAVGLITAKATHIVWPPRRWQRLKPTQLNNRVNTRLDEMPPHLTGLLEGDELGLYHDSLDSDHSR